MEGKIGTDVNLLTKTGRGGTQFWEIPLLRTAQK